MIESKKYPIVTPIMACIFIIVQHVLFSGTAIPQYDQNGTRFYLYSVALGLVAVGGNLLACETQEAGDYIYLSEERRTGA